MNETRPRQSSQVSVPTVPRAKGLAFRTFLNTLEAIRGKETYNAALTAMPREMVEALRYGKLIASGWYPLDWYNAMLKAIVSTSNEGDRVIREIGREAIRADLKGIYKLVFKVLSPETLYSVSSRIFSSYFDTGKAEPLEIRKGYVRIRWTGCTGFDRQTWIVVFSAGEMLLEFAGASNVRLHVISGAGPNDDHAEVHYRWT
jgi:hypothetical protein